MALPNQIRDLEAEKEKNSTVKWSIALLILGGLLLNGHVQFGGWMVLFGVIGLVIAANTKTTKTKQWEGGIYK
jgi:hypothetical protein